MSTGCSIIVEDDHQPSSSPLTSSNNQLSASFTSQNHSTSKLNMSTSSISSTLMDHNDSIASGTTNTTTTTTTINTPTSVKRDSYKDRKKRYQKQKKKAAEDLLSVMNDPTVLVMGDWLKVRGTLKGWTKLYCELKPGLLVLYKNQKTHKSGYWVGTVLLNVCDVIERPSKKDGFCFKIFNTLEQTIWSPRVCFIHMLIFILHIYMYL